jgi:hypothetical protein
LRAENLSKHGARDFSGASSAQGLRHYQPLLGQLHGVGGDAVKLWAQFGLAPALQRQFKSTR